MHETLHEFLWHLSFSKPPLLVDQFRLFSLKSDPPNPANSILLDHIGPWDAILIFKWLIWHSYRLSMCTSFVAVGWLNSEPRLSELIPSWILDIWSMLLGWEISSSLPEMEYTLRISNPRVPNVLVVVNHNFVVNSIEVTLRRILPLICAVSVCKLIIRNSSTDEK